MDWRRLFPVVLLLVALPYVHALVNVSVAKDWRIAYLLGYYSRLKGEGFLAADSAATAKEVFPYILPKNQEIVIYEDDDPFVKNYQAYLSTFGFGKIRTIHVSDPYKLNFDLLASTGPYDCYVIVQDSAGEWIYAAGAYAFARKCGLVLLSNRSIDRIISTIPASADITVVGYAGKRLHKVFPNARFISTGSKAADAVELAKLFPHPYSQVYVVSGMFLYLPINPSDYPIWTGGGGQYPILIAYPDGMPKVTKDFLLSHDNIKAVVFIGPELDPVFGRFREEVGNKKITRILINIGFQNIPTRKSGVPYPLPVLLLPSGDVKITLENVSALPDGRIFLRFRNVGDAGGYARLTYIRLTCGELTIEPNVPQKAFFVAGKDSTIVEVNAGEALPDTGCKIYVEGRYGPDVNRLMFDFNGTLTFMPEKINDDTHVSVERVMYSPRLEAFVIFAHNDSSEPAYVTPSLIGVLVDGVPTNFKGRTYLVKPGETKRLYVKAVLTDADFIDNPEVKVLLRYGKYRNLPIKIFSGTYPLEKETLTDVVIEFVQENWLLVAVGLALLIIILLILRRR